MKKLLKMLMIVVIISAFSITSSAKDGADKYIDDFEETLPEDLGGLTVKGGLIKCVSIEGLLAELSKVLSGRGGEIFSFFLMIIGVSALSSLSSFAPEGARAVTECGVGVACASLLISRVLPLFSETRESIDGLTAFFSDAAPIMSAVTLAGGGAGGAAVESAGIGLALAFVGDVLCTALSGAVGFSLALGLLSCFGDPNVSSVAASVKNLFMWLVGIATLIIMGTLSLQSVVTAAADSAAMRSAKYAASGLIPIVGGTVSGSLSTLASGLSYAKGVIGAGAVAVIVASAVGPLAVLLLYRLSFTVGLKLCESFSASRSASVLKAFASSLDALIAVYSLAVIIYVFEIILFIKSGVALLG